VCVCVCVCVPEVEVLQLLQAADLRGQLLYLVVEHVQNLQVLQLSDVGGHNWKTHTTHTETQ